MTLSQQIVNTTVRGLTALVCRVNAEQLAKIPDHGPLILVANHINFLDVPVIITRLQPRPVTGFAKAETWKNSITRILFNIWGAIPIRRGEADLVAIKLGLKALEEGKILAITPEGTRSNDGCLRRGYPGVATIALLSQAPILPMVFYGNENYRQNLPRLRRSDFQIVVGQPFKIDPCGGKVTSVIRQKMADEIMYQLAMLLPKEYRGVYVDLEKATQEYLSFL